MMVYHGSVIEVTEPHIIKHEIGRDFGFAFYTTDIKDQAVRWAKRKAMIANRNGSKNYVPVISQYDWDDEISREKINVKEFIGASMEWLEMVVKCRSDRSYIHKYDIVIGKIANDNVGETVSYVLQGIMRKEDAIERLKFETINNQIAFCSEKAFQYLKYRGHFME